MTQAYANRILGIALAMAAVILAGVWIASRLYDRKTRQLKARRGDVSASNRKRGGIPDRRHCSVGTMLSVTPRRTDTQHRQDFGSRRRFIGLS